MVAAGQAPLPSQFAEEVWLLPVLVSAQLSLRQPVETGQGWHLPPPSQVPALLQSPADALLAAQRPLGSEVPEGTLVQVPGATVEVPLHVLQRAPVEASAQAVLQQTPSVQKPLRHWLALEHAAPFTLRPQDPFTQVAGGTQSLDSVAEVQLILQAPFSHTKPPQDRLPGVAQLPWPVQVEAGDTAEDGPPVVLATQLAGGLQGAPDSTKAQPPARHSPVRPHCEDSVTAHLP
jgi:hypothetical protein